MSEKNTTPEGYSSLKGLHKAVPIILGTVAVFTTICLFTNGTGAVGGGICRLLRGLFSWGAVIIPISLIVHALCYSDDLANKRIKSRAIFSGVATLLASCVDYAISTIGGEVAFTPGISFITMSNGGFVGGVIGYLLTSVIGRVGVILLSVAVLAIYALFFFAERAGALGQAALKISGWFKDMISKIKEKIKANAEKRKILKEEADQHRREFVSDELADDDFFTAKGDPSEVRIKKLGIEENAGTHGTSPLLEHEIVIEEPVAVEEPERKRKRSDKPIDTSYGLENDSAPAQSTTTKIPSTRLEFGLDDSADNVFTKDFDPFDFATSEKRAAKFANRVAVASPIAEELDEMALAEMRANHEPTERELRVMELERKKKEWMMKRQKEQAASKPASAPVVESAPITEAPAPQVTTPAPAAESEPAPIEKAEPIRNIPAAQVSRAPYVPAPKPQTTLTPEDAKPTHGGIVYNPTRSTKTLFNPPVKPVEFVVTKEAKPEPQPVKVVEEPKKEENKNEAEDIAILIAEKIARSNPGYARSANDLKTFTKVVSSEDDELYRQLQGMESAPADEHSEYEPTVAEPEETIAANDEPAEEFLPQSVEFSVGDESAVNAPSTQSTYQRAAGYATAMVSDEAATPEFKPYTPPTSAIETAVSEEATLRVERSMLSSAHPTQEDEEIAFDSVDEEESVATPSDEIDFAPEADEVETETADETSSEPLFDVIAEDEEYEDDEIEEDIEDEADEADEDEIEDEEEPEEDEPTEEIPPEEQNPDVIKMRRMFPCLEPIGEKKPASAPSATEEDEITTEAEDEPPFEEPTYVKPAPAPTALVPLDTKKVEKKNKPDYSDYQFPPLDFLASQEELRDDNIAIETQENADKLIETLASFGVTAFTKGMDRGPRITRYEVVPAKGVKVSSILNLQDDIALNLAAGSIRMEAPIPGKSAVGIEIPNKTSSTVRLRDLLETPDFQTSSSKTFVCIGRDVAGQPVFGDLAKMPHLLIAGATGMGKSVCINSLLISILYKAKPDEVKFIMIDPKQVEFTMYNGIPHLLVPVVSDPKQAAGALMWAVEEMDRRFDMLKPLCVRNIDAYNEKVAADPSLGQPMPKIIIVIDEFADLMLQVKDPVEALVMRIAQKARAAGIHLVIGTQRPSVNVITGVIKANVPSRISCKVMSNVDSKTVLDSGGAEKLLDKGDALYAPSGAPKPHRVQCAFVADAEVETIMNYLKQYSDGDAYDSSVMEDIERAAQRCSKKGGGDRDEADASEGSGEGYLNDRQFLDAVEIAVNTRKISTSLIQRKMSIGYGKAAKFIDVMEDMGIVGPANGQRPRDVMLTPDEWREKLARASLE